MLGYFVLKEKMDVLEARKRIKKYGEVVEQYRRIGLTENEAYPPYMFDHISINHLKYLLARRKDDTV